MNPTLNEMLATTRRDQFLVQAEQYRLIRLSRADRVRRTGRLLALRAALGRVRLGPRAVRPVRPAPAR